MTHAPTNSDTSWTTSWDRAALALRLLCVQEEIEPRTLDLLKGYMEELTIGDPRHLSTDVGPVIDAQFPAGSVPDILA